MALIRSVFWFAIFLAATFAFTVIFEHGFSDFSVNAQKEFDLLSAVLKESPGFLDGRKILRRAEIMATKGRKSFLSGLSTASLKGSSLMKKDPLSAMELAEKTLETDPYNVQANQLLRDSAKAAE